MGLGTLGGGLGVARWLLRHGARLTVTDLRDRHALAGSVEALEKEYARRRRGRKGIVYKPRYVLGRHEPADFSGADMVVRNPAVPREHELLRLARRRKIAVETDISLFFRLCPFPITAVTGTKGKSTTTALLGAMVRRHDSRTVIGGNIRISPFDHLDGLLAAAGQDVPPPVVLELSSWQLEGLVPHRLSPHIGVLTNIMEDHLNRYRDLDDYARAKATIVAYQRRQDIGVFNADDARVRKIAAQGRGRRKPAGRRFWFGSRVRSGDGCYLDRGHIVIRDRGVRRRVMPVSGLPLPGSHNVSNVLAACAAAHHLGIPIPTMRAAIRSFRGVPDRLEILRRHRGVLYVNDTTATMPEACVAALRAYGTGRKRRIILIAGGADKELRFDDWSGEVGRTVKHLILFRGSATPKMEEALERAGVSVPTYSAGSMSEAVREARRHAERGDVVLLSPACASFGLFRNEFDRGDRFRAAVRRPR